MCGRYVLSLPPSAIRRRLAEQEMYAEEGPEDDGEDRVLGTYNFAPGYHGLIFRAETTDHGANHDDEALNDEHDRSDEPSPKRRKVAAASPEPTVDGLATKETKYKLQAARWGLIPFWTKRPPDYASKMRTINCRDDSLIENRGMWNTMKQRKRCIVIAEGFYEWLKKNNGKQKVPHYMKRKDGQLMCFAGLWDMVQYEGSQEKLYTYTIITTDSNPQLKFLHDRMPVILEPGSESMKTWLDPKNVGWSKELQSMLKPYGGELECYPVDQAVGKVGNNSPSFVIPVDSKDNKKNIANFFGNQAEKALTKVKPGVKEEATDDRRTTDVVESTEDNAPLPEPKHELEDEVKKEEVEDEDMLKAADDLTEQSIKKEADDIDDKSLLATADNELVKLEPANKPHTTPSPSKRSKKQTPGSERRARNATTNNTPAKTPTSDGNAKITSFFGR